MAQQHFEEQYKYKIGKHSLYTLQGDILCREREQYPIYSGKALAEADLFLYQVCNAYTLPEDKTQNGYVYWFPTCYVYAGLSPLPEWVKLKSRSYCEKKMFKLFGVGDID